MDNIQELALSETIRLDLASFNLDVPSPLPSGLQIYRDVCLRKVAGSLVLNLNPAMHLGLDDRFNFEVTLHGTPAGMTEAGRPIVVWSAEQALDRVVSVPVVDLYLRAVRCHLEVELFALEPRIQGAECCSEQASYGVLMASIGHDDFMVVEGDIVTKGAGAFLSTFRANADDFYLLARGGRHYEVGVRINVARNECGVRRPHFVLEVTAPDNARVGPITWSASGPVAQTGPSDRWFFDVHPAGLDAIQIDVVCAIDGRHYRATMAYVPETPEARASKELICRVNREVIYAARDPLWDPVPWLQTVVRLDGSALTRADVARVQRFAGSLLRDSTRLLALLPKVRA